MPLEPEEFLDALAVAGRLAGAGFERQELGHEVLSCPHQRPRALPAGTQAIYVFLLGDTCLKVGKAGPDSHARFATQHYGSNAPSTLAQSIIRDRSHVLRLTTTEARAEVEALTIESVGRWLQRRTSRFHVLLPAHAPACALTFAEAFTQCRLRPVYEG